MIYRVFRNGIVLKIDGDTQASFMQSDPQYAQFEAWVEAGGVPETEPEPEPMLTPEQWVYFLEQTQWTALIKQATDMMPPGPVRSALIAAQATTTAFRLPVLLKVVGRVRAMGLGIDLPTDEQITAAFEEASNFEGLGALLE